MENFKDSTTKAISGTERKENLTRDPVHFFYSSDVVDFSAPNTGSVFRRFILILRSMVACKKTALQQITKPRNATNIHKRQNGREKKSQCAEEKEIYTE